MISELVLSPVVPGAAYLWGLEVIRAFQFIAHPLLTAVVKAVTFLGEPAAYVILIAVIFWCIDERRGALLGITILFSTGVNTVIKDTLRVPRPFYHDPSVKLIEQSGFSTPSAHAQGSASFWGLFVLTMRSGSRRSRSRRSGPKWAVGLGIPLLVGLSRIYLGVHYPTDVVFGWGLGAVTAAGFALGTRYAAPYLSRTPRGVKLLLLAVPVFIMNALNPGDTSMPALLLGFGGGYIFLADSGGFDASKGTPMQKVLRLAAGLAGIGVIYLGLKSLLPEGAIPGEGSPHYQLFRFLRYMLCGVWAGFGAPKLFIRLGIALPGAEP